MIKNSRGQMTIEAILLLTIFIGIFLLAQKTFKSKKYISQMVEGPWSYVQGMIEDGVWLSASNSKSKNPNLFNRHASPEVPQ